MDRPQICSECDHWSWEFETDSQLVGYCAVKNAIIDGLLQPYFNKCNQFEHEWYPWEEEIEW